MANKSQTFEIRGKTSFAKILEDQLHLNFGKDGKEWTVDIVLDKETAKEVKNYGIADKVKSKDNYLDGAPYLTFKQKEYRFDGVTANDPIPVVDIFGKPWDQTKKIGNGSVVDIRFRVVDYGPGKKNGMYPAKIRVLEHVPYEGDTFKELSADDEYFRKAVAAQEAEVNSSVGLDDDVSDVGDDAI